MRTAFPLLAFAASAALLAACTAEPSAPAATPQSAAPDAASANMVRSETALLDFTYSWPDEAAAIPTLVRHFRTEAEAERADALGEAEEDRDARGGGDSFFAHSYTRAWRLAGESARLLSLVAESDRFTGGAHPNMVFVQMLWDREADTAVAPRDLLAEPEAALARLTPVYCEGLDRQRAEKRGETLPLSGDDWLTACPALAEQIVVPADGNGDGRFDHLRILLPAYAAGPYAEGPYEIELPVDPTLIGYLKPEYRTSFAP